MTLILCCALVARVALLVSADSITEPLRERLRDWATPGWREWFTEGVHCPWCCSVWIAPWVAWLALARPDSWWFLLPAYTAAGSLAAGISGRFHE